MTMHLYQSVKSNEFESLVVGALDGARTSSVYRGVAKRALDIMLVLLATLPALMIALPFVLLVALDGRSPFYRQRRVGRNGAVFNMWKLRSMVPNADQMLEGYLAANPAARSEWDLTQKLRHDPRITKVGHLIRKTSIDELPQLWNVLKGDMSIVGPRPMMVDQQKIYPGTAYYALRPGITGFWQTSVRNESSFADRAQFDTDYLRQMSFLTDFRVMLRTVRVVVNGTGC
ncbi:MAG: sugar transferase [Pseudomonadota bacterium]|uniref:Sugar transferase involved in LPS biosynthesis (Colanic, teichoic acid) n=1 Tax=Thalassococcus halodurans TaxID=373675 RepID=A0A1H5YV00_9RHOB|nr:sugar transferase [Thalassococcus halodurans]MEE3359158.1 sugar transferase [Pseudomonadota bacterium]SEG27562.1 Sugar transferase involved in LPS biosynthesis (colanic, teichoic acid) [Thalassococcus halodurans]